MLSGRVLVGWATLTASIGGTTGGSKCRGCTKSSPFLKLSTSRCSSSPAQTLKRWAGVWGLRKGSHPKPRSLKGFQKTTRPTPWSSDQTLYRIWSYCSPIERIAEWLKVTTRSKFRYDVWTHTHLSKRNCGFRQNVIRFARSVSFKTIWKEAFDWLLENFQCVYILVVIKYFRVVRVCCVHVCLRPLWALERFVTMCTK